MNKYLLLIAIIFVTFPVFGQKQTDVVYLKNGSIIKGKIINESEEILRIETCCGNIFVFRSDEILSIKQEEFKPNKTVKEKGYLNFTSLGILIGTGRSDKEAPFSLIIENNYRFNKYLALGGLVGLETLNEAVFPVGVNVKGMLPFQKGSVAYAGFSAGYSISLEKPPADFTIIKAYGGFLFNPEIGFITPTGSNGSFFMAIGYRYNQLNYRREDWYFEDPVERKQIYNRLSIKLGICFQ